ncbi:diguanylate cyclase (GGDEF) domain-containing protein [Devosia sp. YR412]|uniref:GGDEF domain-containing protein n=1 Tax=Devosia sp. YR412 TaxID=1881030 RepID=UPI0008BC0BE8|nr:tetratricopeptide repeat-containing diguanylate cyclase [Devosia sp. YR412]SEQ02120.1 diguanylate cyclase (GGDEF) domain-containing protein [Devosia sp. YR412]
MSENAALSDELAESWRLACSGQSVVALSRAKLLFKRLQDSGDDRAIAACLTQIAWFCLQLGQAEHGLDCAYAAKRLWGRCEDTSGEVHATAIASWLLLEMGLTEEAFEEADRALELAERQSDPAMLARALNAKAIVLMYSRQPELSGPLLDRAMDLVEMHQEPGLMALLLINRAYGQVTSAEMAEFEGDAEAGRHWRDLAVDTNDAAIAAAEASGDGWNLRTALCNGAEYHVLLDRPEQAHDYLGRWAGVAGEPGLRERIHLLYTKGEVLTLTGRLAEALEICEQAVALADGTTHTDHQANAVRRLSDVHEAMGNFEAALALHKRYHGLYERQLSEVTRRRAHVADIRDETSKLRAAAERLAEEAAHDGLTGLSNRRSFDQAMLGLEGTEFALAIVDLDFFKSVNDLFSHVVGDAVLRQVGALLATHAENGVQAFRLGGEEFALIFPQDDLDSAARHCEAIRAEIAAVDWQALGEGLTVTASIGVATGSNGSALMSVADGRLYDAKAAGRNRVVSMDALEPRYGITG